MNSHRHSGIQSMTLSLWIISKCGPRSISLSVLFRRYRVTHGRIIGDAIRPNSRAAKCHSEANPFYPTTIPASKNPWGLEEGIFSDLSLNIRARASHSCLNDSERQSEERIPAYEAFVSASVARMRWNAHRRGVMVSIPCRTGKYKYSTVSVFTKEERKHYSKTNQVLM